MRRALGLLFALPAPALAATYHDFGRPEQCGDYAEASFDGESWFGGGEGGLISLTDPQSVRGLNATLFEGIISEEGFSDPAGRVLALQGTLLTSDGPANGEALVIMTNAGIRVLLPCP